MAGISIPLYGPGTGSGSSSISSVVIQDQKTAATGGGTFTDSTWLTRDLTNLINPASNAWVSLSSNQFTLNSGTYHIIATCPAINCAYYMSRLYNVTDSSVVCNGSAEYSAISTVQTHSVIQYTFTLSAQKTLRIEQRTGTAGGNLGQAAGNNIGESNTNVYTQVTIIKLA